MRRRAHCFSVQFDNFSGTKQKKADDIQQMKEKLKDMDPEHYTKLQEIDPDDMYKYANHQT